MNDNIKASIIERLKGVEDILDGVIVMLRSMQHKRLQSAVNEEDLIEARTIKEVIHQLESVA